MYGDHMESTNFEWGVSQLPTKWRVDLPKWVSRVSYKATRGLFAKDHFILNLCRVTRTTVPSSPKCHTTLTGGIFEQRQILLASAPLNGGSAVALGFELVTRHPRVRDYGT
ncbi:hypothetical protein TNCV_2305221 [Trichonephila clavipes]|nr:hypothetical protein TNCV_2305221 [Trichonephila clavipes]